MPGITCSVPGSPLTSTRVDGGVKGHEHLAVSWDARADIEAALLQDTQIALASVDYLKYFDSFDDQWVHGFLLLLGFPPCFADMILDFYLGLQRSIKLGKALGQPHHYANGCGQGDATALFPAIAFVSGQFRMIELLFPKVTMGACIDDRNCRGALADVISTYHAVHAFCKMAGHKLQDSKSIITSTCAVERQAI